MEDSNNKKIKDLTPEELTELIQDKLSGNQIEVSGVTVMSQKGSLKKVEATVNRLIEKHSDFLLLRKELKLKTHYPD